MNETLSPAPPALDYLGRLEVHVAAPVEVGHTHAGQRRVIPITGGTFAGPRGQGQILAAGADFQLLRTPSEAFLDARYVVAMEDGARLFVTNAAYRTGAVEDIQALVRGEVVPPERIYFRCAPHFEVADTDEAAWGWLSTSIVIGSGQREPDRVIIDLWVVR